MKFIFAICFTLLVITSSSFAEDVGTSSAEWTAPWITPAEGLTQEYGVYLFRRAFKLKQIPESLVVYVTADQRYKLNVNGTEVSLGPCRGTLDDWRYEKVNLAPYLHVGKNILTAVVWNMGTDTPAAQISLGTAFRLQSQDRRFAFLDTSEDWRYLKCTSYSPLPIDRKEIPYYYVVGPGDIVDGNTYPWQWQTIEFDDSKWLRPTPLKEDTSKSRWQLTLRELPAMEKKENRFKSVRKSGGVEVGDQFVAGTAPLQIPPHTSARILLDYGVLTNAYPHLLVSGGKGATIESTYAEGLWETQGQSFDPESVDLPQVGKGNRDDIEGKVMLGNHDRFICDGGKEREFSTLWFRTFRYVEFAIETKDEPLELVDIKAEDSAFPLSERAWFRSDRDSLTDLWNVGWRTLRLCANETMYDCPYYEQLQYVGDTRTQANFMRYLSGDDRLPRRAIQAFYESINEEGISQSRYPCNDPQYIPPYSLFWISMLYDDWQWRGDKEFIASYIDGVKSIIAWHEQYMHESGMLGKTPGWRFVDWAFAKMKDEPHGGIPPYDDQQRSSMLSLQLAYALDHGSQLVELDGNAELAQRWRKLSESIKKHTRELCWDEEKGLMADSPAKDSYCQQANIFTILTDTIPENEQPELMRKLMSKEDMPQATVYFRYYYNRALEKVGMSNEYLDTLQPWQEMLELGLTTFAETPEPSRSDCHAWGSSPGYEFLRIVTGMRPTSPGCRTIVIAPAFGELKEIDAGIPLPQGMVRVRLKRNGENTVSGNIELPKGVSGEFHWKGKKDILDSGSNLIDSKEMTLPK